jgi:hypothetical protein
MKKNILTILLVLFCLYGKSQKNLVGNGDFETNTGTFSGDPQCQHSTRLQWLNAAPWDIPNVTPICLKCWFSKASCGACVGSPDLDREFITTTTPNYFNYFGTTLGLEYILQKLPTPMISNHLYFIQFDARNPNAPNASAFGGIHFNMKQPEQCASRNITDFGFYEPNVLFPAVDYADHQWHTVTAYWVAKNGFDYMTMGDIRENVNNEDFGINWDNFKIFDVGTSECSPYNYIQNLNFQNVSGILYKSQIQTASGNIVDGSQTPGDVHVTNTATDVTFISETEVDLMPGFNADPGCTFNAFIAPCNNYACPLASAYIGAGHEYCSMAGQQVQLGGSSSGSETYAWNATGSNGANMNSYLSSTTSPNPVLTIPSGAGVINISETAYNTCSGTSSTDEQAIYYDDNPSTNPIVSVSPANQVITPNNPNAAFTITTDTHVEDVFVQLYDNSNNLINEVDLYNFPLTTNGTYNFNYNQYDITYSALNPCSNYHYVVTSKNICSDNLASTNANVTTNIGGIDITNKPNVFSPNGDGINDLFCFGVIGATSYNIQVSNGQGEVVYNGSGSVTTNTPCVWDGQCNNACGLINHQNGIVCNGYYAYVLTFNACNGAYYTIADQVELFGYCARMAAQNDTTKANLGSSVIGPKYVPVDSTVTDPVVPLKPKINDLKSQLGNYVNVTIYPNPTTGLISIILNASNAGKLLVNINSVTGMQIMSSTFNAISGTNNFKLDLSNLGQGAYFINITDENGVSIKNSKVMLIGQ